MFNATNNQPAALSTTQYVVIVIGQSLARGGGGDLGPAISTTQPYGNQMFSQGVLTPTAQVDDLSSLSPLVEGQGTGYPYETPCSGIANEIHALVGNSNYDCIIGSWGLSGQCYSTLAKNGTGGITNEYFKVMTAVSNLVSRFNHVRVLGIVSVHGECDDSTATYARDINTWQSDFETDIKAVTGQSEDVPMFHTQVQRSDQTTGASMLLGCETNSTKSIMVGPKHWLSYEASGTHLKNFSYRSLGELYGKAIYHRSILQETNWKCLQPQYVLVSSNIITVKMMGNVGPILWDTNLVAVDTNTYSPPDFKDPYGYGFIWHDDGLFAPSISSIAITDPTNAIITITLSSASTNSGQKFLFYMHSGGGAHGPMTGVRGCLRDSDPTIGLDGTNLYNWSVSFSKSGTGWTFIQ